MLPQKGQWRHVQLLTGKSAGYCVCGSVCVHFILWLNSKLTWNSGSSCYFPPVSLLFNLVSLCLLMIKTAFPLTVQSHFHVFMCVGLKVAHAVGHTVQLTLQFPWAALFFVQCCDFSTLKLDCFNFTTVRISSTCFHPHAVCVRRQGWTTTTGL